MIKMRIEGVHEVLQNLKNWESKFLKEVSDIIQSGALQIMRDSSRNAPVDTGVLRASIKKYKISPLIAEVRDGVKYGVYQELGTHKMKAHPFMRPALEKNKPKIIRKIKEAVK